MQFIFEGPRLALQAGGIVAVFLRDPRTDWFEVVIIAVCAFSLLAAGIILLSVQ